LGSGEILEPTETLSAKWVP